MPHTSCSRLYVVLCHVQQANSEEMMRFEASYLVKTVSSVYSIAQGKPMRLKSFKGDIEQVLMKEVHHSLAHTICSLEPTICIPARLTQFDELKHYACNPLTLCQSYGVNHSSCVLQSWATRWCQRAVRTVRHYYSLAQACEIAGDHS